MDIKVLRETDARGLQRWEPILKASFPLDAAAARTVFEGLRRPLPAIPPDGLTLDALIAAADVDVTGGPRAVRVHKRRTRYTSPAAKPSGPCSRPAGNARRSIAVESTDPADVLAAIDALGLRDYCNLDVPTALRLLVDRVPERYAVIDVGTNSIKFHIAELDADGRGPWRTVVGPGGRDPARRGPRGHRRDRRRATRADRAGDQRDGARGSQRRRPGHRRRSVRRGLRMARNRAEVVETIRARSGLTLDIISGEDEGRLAYLAVATGVGLGDGSIVAFDTGGGSSQFTFGQGSTVDERFSLNVGAVRFTERFGLAKAVSADVVADALAAIAAELTRLDGRPRRTGSWRWAAP